MPQRPRKRARRAPPRLRLCPFRDSGPLPDVMPKRGELWRLSDGWLARVHMVSVTGDERLSYAFVTLRMRDRNVPLQAFSRPAQRCPDSCRSLELW